MIRIMTTQEKPPRTWRTYEEVAVYLLDSIAAELGLERVEGEHKLVGHRSGRTWNVEGIGIKGPAGEAFVILECRRRTTSRLKQEDVGAIVYRILDTGA